MRRVNVFSRSLLDTELQSEINEKKPSQGGGHEVGLP